MTGAFSGMGRAAAEYLAGDGAEVHAIDVKPVDLPVAASYEVDLRDPGAIDDVAARIAASLGSFDILLNCAGLPHSSFPANEIFQVNYLALRRLTNALVPSIPRGGCVGNITSKSGLNWPELRTTIEEVLPLDDHAATKWFAGRADLHASAYGFSKACATFWSITQATPLGAKGIRINCISPGATDTPMMEHFRKGRTADQLNKATGVIGRMSRPEEQAYPLLFLASDAASYVSGVNLVVDAGALAGFISGQLTPPDTGTYKNVRSGSAVSA